MSSPRSHASSRSEIQQVQAPGQIIEVDAEDADSSYPESLQVSDTTSLRSSILKYKWENGRRYHAYQDGAYWAPNDEQQQDAEDLMHELHRIILDQKLCQVPIQSNWQRVLDVGCGTGMWAIDFADENPYVEVVGFDLSPIQPGFVPPNCSFEVLDMNDEWAFPENHFDFVHIRFVAGCVPDLVEFHKKALKHLKPGGWIEHIEMSCIAKSDDDTIKDDSPLITWVDIFRKVGKASGKTFFTCEEAHDSVKNAGFVEVHDQRVKLPVGTWPKDKTLKQWGAWNRQFLVQGLEGFSIRGLIEILGWSFEQTQVFLVEMRKELLNPIVHSYVELSIVTARKSLEEDAS